MDYNKVWFSPSQKQARLGIQFIEGVFFSMEAENAELGKNYDSQTFLARSSDMLDLFRRLHFYCVSFTNQEIQKFHV